MNGPFDIDQIVREVLARLRDGDAKPAIVDGSAAAKPVEIAKNKSAAVADTTAGRLELTERLVTLATLENRLQGIQHVVLRRGTVVTPSAHDLLRSRNIHTSHAVAPAAGGAARAGLVLGIADLHDAAQSFDRATFLTSLGRERLNVERVAEAGTAAVVAELADHAARGGRATVLLTSEPEASACLANRSAGVRAVGGRDANALRQAITATAANFVAVDPTPAPQAVRRLLCDYYTGFPRAVPAMLNGTGGRTV